MNKTFLISIAVVFCVISSAKEAGEKDVIISEKGFEKYITVDTAVNKEFHLNTSVLIAPQEDECKCENGKCQRECDVDKTKPCDEQRKVCVCNPEFAKKWREDEKCTFCNCGEGINCKFSYIDSKSRVAAECICPKGQYQEFFPDQIKCLTECSDKRPCLNGGSCYSKKCHCSSGISGDLCRDVDKCNSMCHNRHEVSCLYSDDARVAYCNCKNYSLYFDQEANICKPCPCENGICDYEFSYSSRKLICKCKLGYTMFNGYCKKCDCGLGSRECEFDSRGNKICNCGGNYYEREGRCVDCACTRYGDLDTKCEVTGNVKRCFCKLGFQDVNGFCEDINECEPDNPCHSTATCRNLFGTFECRCRDGYRGRRGAVVGPREVCEDIDECQELDHSCLYWTNVECVNLPGSYKCECLPGYEPRSSSDEPHLTNCIRASKSVVPAVIAVSTALVLMAVSCFMHIIIKRRATRSN